MFKTMVDIFIYFFVFPESDQTIDQFTVKNAIKRNFIFLDQFKDFFGFFDISILVRNMQQIGKDDNRRSNLINFH